MNERLYLGVDSDSAQRAELKTDRLTTHGVIVGMTGSGKTGFGLVMLEELVRAKVPIIAIDPKGDLANLAMLFPDFDMASFAGWVEEPSEAESIASRWKSGVEASGLTGDDVRALRDGSDIRVFTPGSSAGVGVDLLGAFRRPTGAVADDEEARAALVQSTVSGLLGLAGRTPDPVRDPAHIVLSRIVRDAWDAGEDPDLSTLVLRLVDPPFEKVGVFPLDRFFPPDDRMEIAMSLNAVLASPSFARWREGVALDIEELLHKGDKTRVSIFNIAHLDEVQRSFFLSLLLGKLLAHTRQMPGTSGLRGLIFFDEVAGYLPPHPKNPPTKAPLLTMMKQARAVGIGVVLSTQNPVDLDYKALSNAGIWAIGRLQTQQDRDRVLKGMGRTDLDDRVEALKKREFVLFDAKADAPVVLKTRHAMCYLRGPLTRVEIARLHESPLTSTPLTLTPLGGTSAPEASPAAQHAGATTDGAAPPTSASSAGDGLLAARPGEGDSWFLDERVVFSKALSSVFESAREPAREDGTIVYRPALWADLSLRFDEDRAGFFLERRERRFWFPLGDKPNDEPRDVPLPDSTVLDEPVVNARFSPLPSWLDESKELTQLRKRVVDDVYRNETAGMFVHKKMRMNARADETKDQFAARVRKVAADKVDDELAKLHERYQKKADQLQDKLDRAASRVMEIKGKLGATRTEELVDVGATIFSMFAGRGKLTGSKVSRAVRKRGRTSNTARRLDTAEDKLAALQEDVAELQEELEEKVRDLQVEIEDATAGIEDKEIRLEKNDIRVERFGVLWIPVSARA